MMMSQARRQMPAKAGRAGVARGEAARVPVSDEACGPRHETGGAGSALLTAALTRENLRQAFKRVRANKGAAGVDGLDIEQTARLLQTEWPAIRERLLAGTYRPGTTGNDPETGRRRARAGHPDGDGSIDPAGTAPSAATAT